MDLEITDTGFYWFEHGMAPSHIHGDEYEVILFRDNGRKFIYGDTSYSETKNRLFFIAPQVEHGIAFLDGVDEFHSTPITFFWVTFRVNDPGLEKSLREGFPEGWKEVSNKMYRSLNELYLKFLSKSEFMQRSMNFQFLAMLYELFETRLDTTDSPERDTRILEAIRIMKTRLYQKLDLEQLASELKLNKNYFFTLFKKKTGSSPMDYYMDLKLIETSKILLNTDIRLGEFPALFQFYNLSHFSRLFKKKYGKSPSKFRK